MALHNWKVAIRVLWRSPLFTLTAVVTIALGIGASTAIFSVTHAVLLQPLPYKDADRLVFAGMELAGVGLYGVLATTVRHRTAEIGVRMALGAEPAKVFQLVVAQGFRVSAIGVACGLVAAVGLTQLMKAMLIGVRATDPATYAVMVLLFLLIAALSSWIPARRAAALDPVKALREE